MFQASQVRPKHAAGRYGDARIGNQIKIASSGLVACHWFSRPGSVRSFAHTGHCSPHIADVPHAAVSRPRRLDLGNPLVARAWPRPCVPSCWPARWPQACAAFGSACARAMIPAAHRHGLANGRSTSPQRSAGVGCRADPSSRFSPASACRHSNAVAAQGQARQRSHAPFETHAYPARRR